MSGCLWRMDEDSYISDLNHGIRVNIGKMMRTRKKLVPQLFVFYLPCPSDSGPFVGNHIWDPVREVLFWLPSSQNFRTPVICSSYLVSQKQSSLSFPFLLCGFFLQLPCVGLIHLTHHCHLNKAIIIKRLYLIIYLSSWYLHAYARNDAQLKAITNLPPRSSCNWCQQHRSTPLTVCMWRGPHSKYIRIGRQLEELLDIWKHPV